MKMVKKILLGMAFTAAVLSFVSCGIKEDEQKAIDGEDIGYTNFNNDDVNPDHKNYRAFVTTQTKHYDAIAEITIDNPEEVNGSKGANAVLGFVFGVKEHVHSPKVKISKDGETKDVTFYDFGIAGVRWNKNKGKVEWYVSWCEDVPNTIIGFNNDTAFGNIEITDVNGLVGTFGTETVIVPDTGIFEDVAIPLTDGKLKISIKTQANNDGGYTVKLCNAEGTTVKTANIDSSDTGITSKEERYIGRYLSVYYGESIKGVIKYSDVNGNVIPADYRED